LIRAVLDATAKPQAGILLGNIMHVGNYDECLEVDEDLFGMKIQGKYCTAVLQAHPTYGEDFAKLLTSLNVKGCISQSIDETSYFAGWR
jgi:hypothetical protein